LVPLDVPHFHQCGSQDHLQLSVQQEVFILGLGKATNLLVAPYIGDSGIQPIDDHFFKLGGNLPHTFWSGHFFVAVV
jgi:hypothetical protein